MTKSIPTTTSRKPLQKSDFGAATLCLHETLLLRSAKEDINFAAKHVANHPDTKAKFAPVLRILNDLEAELDKVRTWIKEQESKIA